MTFYEAAIQILEREGRPLHAREITERALEENLLSHVGKQPDVVMASRLAAMARKSQDRRLVAVAPDTFGLADWNLETDPEALEKSGVVTEPEEASQPPLRGQERHPKISKENVRIMGRGERRRREEARRAPKGAPKSLPELVQAILASASTPLPLFELAAAIRETDFVQDDLGRETLRQRLVEENERLEKADASPVFFFLDDGLVGLEGMEAPAEPVDAQRLIETALARLIRPKAAPKAPPAAPADLEAQSRQQSVEQLRARLLELTAEALEGVTVALLQEMGYREVRVAKRQKDGSLFVAKRRMGLTEIRFAVRVLRGGRDVRRDDVQELRKDLQSHSAQIGVVVSPSDPTREARSEAARTGQGVILLLCADALAEQLVERGIGVATRTITVTEFDPRALAARARRALRGLDRSETAEEAREPREKERRERKSRKGRRGSEAEAAAQGASGETAEATEAEKAPEGVPAEARGEVAPAGEEKPAKARKAAARQAEGEPAEAETPAPAETRESAPAPEPAAGEATAKPAEPPPPEPAPIAEPPTQVDSARDPEPVASLAGESGDAEE